MSYNISNSQRTIWRSTSRVPVYFSADTANERAFLYNNDVNQSALTKFIIDVVALISQAEFEHIVVVLPRTKWVQILVNYFKIIQNRSIKV